MKIKIENMPEGLTSGTYDVEMVEVEYTKGQAEPVMRLRFMPPQTEPETTFLLVEVEKEWADMAAQEIAATDAVVHVIAHNEKYPHGCCCQHCPHGGNCRD